MAQNIVLCDNDPKHTSRVAKDFRKRASIGGQHLPVVQILIQLNVYGEN